MTDGKDSKLALRQGLRELFGSCYEARIPVTVPTQGPSWGYIKVNSSETLSIFGDKCP